MISVLIILYYNGNKYRCILGLGWIFEYMYFGVGLFENNIELIYINKIVKLEKVIWLEID